MEAQKNPTLLAERRTESGKGPARRLRSAGLLPIACYGRGMETVNLSITSATLQDALKGPRGMNTVFEIDVEGEDLKYQNVILHDFQVSPLSRVLLHADLMVVGADEVIEVGVPLSTVGRAIGERSGGTLRLIHPEIRVNCTVADIPSGIEFDVSEMGPDDVTMASELAYPEGVEPVYEIDFAVARVMMPRQNVIGIDDVDEEETETVVGEEGEEEEGEDTEETEET